jgi:hypothetical protein
MTRYLLVSLLAVAAFSALALGVDPAVDAAGSFCLLLPGLFA